MYGLLCRCPGILLVCACGVWLCGVCVSPVSWGVYVCCVEVSQDVAPMFVGPKTRSLVPDTDTGTGPIPSVTVFRVKAYSGGVLARALRASGK